jgi:hypothetical protein
MVSPQEVLWIFWVGKLHGGIEYTIQVPFDVFPSFISGGPCLATTLTMTMAYSYWWYHRHWPILECRISVFISFDNLNNLLIFFDGVVHSVGGPRERPVVLSYSWYICVLCCDFVVSAVLISDYEELQSIVIHRGEMSAMYPVSGTYSVYGSRFISPAFGFTLGKLQM